MAERRMFAKTIIDSDAFLDMPQSTQLLYFHLSMRADDEGFINNPKRIQKTIGSSDDDLKILIAKRFIIPFESGVVVIKHWRLHNYIRNDRFKETVYQEEKSQLELKENGVYRLNGQPSVSHGIPNDDQRYPQVRLGKDSIGKDKNNSRTFVPPSLEELIDFIREQGYQVNAETFLSHYESKGWYVGKNKMKDWKAAVRGWSAREKEKPKTSIRDDILPEYENTYQTTIVSDSVERSKLIEQIRKGTK